MSYADYLREDRRLVILKALEASAGYSAGHYVVGRFAASQGHVVSSDVLLSDLAWLAEQGLLTTREAEHITVATLTQRGAECAQGIAIVPGVQRPQPV